MTSAGLPPGHHNGNDSNMDGVIPDKVGTAAIQERIDSIRRRTTGGGDNSSSGIGIRWVPSKASGHRVAAASTRSCTLPRAVWILIFDQGSSQPSPPSCAQRGLYCLWSEGLNSAVAFQDRDGALRYAFKLNARGLGVPRPTRVAMTDLQRFCCDNGFGVWVVPADVVPEAPRKTKDVLGFDPAAAAPRRPVESGGWRGMGENLFSSSSSSSPSSSEENSVLTPEDVRKWRADFERLYAQDE
eukprot:g9851.t1